MKLTIDMDNGGTFTDGFFTSDARIEWVKVDTTPHDLTVCFLACIEEGARRFGLTASQMLTQTDVLRFSTTKGTNTLLTRTGPRLGLIVTRGCERSLYSDTEKSPATDVIIPADMVAGIDEEAGRKGVDLQEVRAAVRGLLGRGARMIVVSFRDANVDPSNEQLVKRMTDEDYPKHYLGAVPLLLGTEVSGTPQDASRTNLALLNAYLHPDMVRFLYKAEDSVRTMGYHKPLMVIHADGGAARVAKTTAIMTNGSGPAAGMLGASFMARRYGLSHVASMDIGGTSTDIGLVIDGKPQYKRETELDGIPVRIPSIEVLSVAAGGGSIAAAVDGRLKLGPESAGAMPGPACYGLGGRGATSTDACVALGYYDPNYFLGGRRKLDGARAREVMERNVAQPLGATLEDCARQVTEAMEDVAAADLSKLINDAGLNAGDFALFTFGGAGGAYCCGVADKVGIPKVYVFQFSSVFCAFGSSCADVVHSYERQVSMALSRGGGQKQVDDFNTIVLQLQQVALRDMRGEGFKRESVSFSLELEASAGGSTAAVLTPFVLAEGEEDINRLLGAIPPAASISMFRLRATAEVPHPVIAESPFVGTDPEKARKGTRDVYWKGGFAATAIFERARLEHGNVIPGPAIVESENTTVLVPAGKKYTVDSLLNGIIEPA